MTYAKLGRSNLSVSRICLGTMHFGTRADEAESGRIMDAALDAGINFFDTADVYGGPGGFGRSRAAELRLDDAVMGRLNALFDINQGRGLRDGREAPEAYAW